MNKIEELIQELCPDGVEFKELGDVISALRTGLNPRQNFKLNLPEAKHFYITVRELNGFKIQVTEKTDRVDSIGLTLIQNRSKIQKGDILFSGTGTIGRTALVSEVPNNWNVKEDIYVITPIFEIIKERFLIYLIQSSQIRNKILAKSDGSTVASISMASIRKIQIPVPPIPIQEEIVRILDSFTTLEAELEAELEARRDQYKYYRDQLLCFEGKEVEWKMLGEVGEFIRGKRFVKTDMISEGVPCIHYGELYTYYNIWTNDTKAFVEPELAKKLRLAKKGDVVIVSAGETIEDIGNGVAWLGDEDVVIHDACFALSHNQNPKYISYYLQTNLFRSQIKRYISSGKISSINAKGLSQAKMPVPPLEEQERIVGILDKFDPLVNDISVG